MEIILSVDRNVMICMVENSIENIDVEKPKDVCTPQRNSRRGYYVN